MARKKSGKPLKTQGSGVSDDTGEVIDLLMEESLAQGEELRRVQADVVALQVVVAALAMRHGMGVHGDN